MKKLLLLIIALLLSLAACTAQSVIPVTTPPAATASPPPTAIAEVSAIASPSAALSVTPAPTVTPSVEQSATPAPSASPSPAKNITVIIASSHGEIYGGYSNGKWLSASEAAALCKGKMTFSRYSLTDRNGTVKSSGITYDEEWYESVGGSSLKLPEDYYAEIDAEPYYENEPLNSTYLYSGGKLPDIDIVSDTSKVSRALQNLLDEKMGKGKAEANILVAVSADIDGDGKKETVVNADGGGEDDSEYCLCCIIESDGTVKVISDYYYISTDEESWSDYRLIYVQNIIDIDGDGMCELVVDEAWGEDDGTTVYKYNGNNVNEVMKHWVYEECP